MIVTDREYLENLVCDIIPTIEYCVENDTFGKLSAELKASKMPGVGIAAPQIGLPLRVILIDDGDYTLRMINPIIEKMYDAVINPNEQCLSCPGESYDTDRFNNVVVKWLDYDTKEERRAIFCGQLGIIVQHEFDHLDSVLIYKRAHKYIKTGRNEPCPECLKNGITIKWKKCSEHNI